MKVWTFYIMDIDSSNEAKFIQNKKINFENHLIGTYRVIHQ